MILLNNTIDGTNDQN